MSIIAIYSRKSKITIQGESIQNQIELCKEYAQTHFAVDGFLIYEDEGYSGGNVDRPRFKRMVGDIQKKKFHVLICYRLDRISRNISDFSSLVELLLDYDIDFVSIGEHFDTSTPMGRAMMYITSVFAQLERETIAERIRDNMYQLARTGRWLGGKTPMGFKSIPVQYQDKDKGPRKMYVLTPIEEELALVKQIYDQYLKLGSLTQLESWTLENNLKTKTNKDFHKSTLKVILTNPVYARATKTLYHYFLENHSDIANNQEDFNGIQGLMVFNKHDERRNKVIRKDKSKWIVAIGRHHGIILSQDWIKVQHILEKNKNKSPRRGTGKIGLITPLLRCKNCGSNMRVTVYRRKSGTYYYYKCLLKEKSRGSRCNIRNINGRVADNLVIDEIKKIGYKEQDIYNYLKEMRNRLIVTPVTPECKKMRLDKQLAKYQGLIRNLTAQLAHNQDTKASKYIIEQIEAYDLKIIEITSQFNKINTTKETTDTEELTIDKILGFIDDFSNNIDKLNFEEKKKLIDSMIYEILWDGEKLEIHI